METRSCSKSLQAREKRQCPEVRWKFVQRENKANHLRVGNNCVSLKVCCELMPLPPVFPVKVDRSVGSRNIAIKVVCHVRGARSFTRRRDGEGAGGKYYFLQNLMFRIAPVSGHLTQPPFPNPPLRHLSIICKAGKVWHLVGLSNWKYRRESLRCIWIENVGGDLGPAPRRLIARLKR